MTKASDPTPKEFRQYQKSQRKIKDILKFYHLVEYLCAQWNFFETQDKKTSGKRSRYMIVYLAEKELLKNMKLNTELLLSISPTTNLNLYTNIHRLIAKLHFYILPVRKVNVHY